MNKLRSVVYVTALLAAAPAFAGESLCGVTDQAAVLSALAGDWDGALSVQIEGDTLSVLRADESGYSQIGTDGVFVNSFLEPLLSQDPVLTLWEQKLDVDRVDDLLEVTEREDIADAVSLTPCGPEALPQLTGLFQNGEELSGQVTLIPYFTDQIVMLILAETHGDLGYAEITGAALLTPDARPAPIEAR